MTRAALGRFALIIAGLAATGAIVWLVGPVLAFGEWRPLQPAYTRWVVIGAIGLGALGYGLWRVRRSVRTNRSLIAGLAVSPGAADSAAIAKRFDEALAHLARRRAGGQRLLYELPWYIIIGAPGAGKTTALANSGLDFGAEASAVRGVGGTRHCDWWFAREAVLIDTAGRFTTQDSDREADRAGWAGFMSLLREHRPQQPINGAIVAVSASELLLADAAAQAELAKNLRERLEELRAQLGIRFPIYVLVTKTDLVAGFDELFADYDRARREQVWGVTLPYNEGAPGPASVRSRPNSRHSNGV